MTHSSTRIANSIIRCGFPYKSYEETNPVFLFFYYVLIFFFKEPFTDAIKMLLQETKTYFQTLEMSVMRFKASRGSGKWSNLSFHTREFLNRQHILLLEMCGVT